MTQEYLGAKERLRRVESGEIQFLLHVDGAESWSWADIRNNGAVSDPAVNQWNELQAQRKAAP